MVQATLNSQGERCGTTLRQWHERWRERLGWIVGIFLRWKILDSGSEGEERAVISNLDSWLDGGGNTGKVQVWTS